MRWKPRKTWEQLIAAVHEIKPKELRESREREEDRKRTKLLLHQLTTGSPTAAIRSSLAGVRLGAPPAAQNFTQYPTSYPRAALATPPSPSPQGSGRSCRQTPAQNRDPIERFNALTRLPAQTFAADDAGINAHTTAVVKWHQDNPSGWTDELHPFPLSPGTLPAGTNECWKCGHGKHMGGSVCERLVPDLEWRYQRTAHFIKRNYANVQESGGPASAVNYIGTGSPYMWHSGWDEGQGLYGWMEGQR